MATLTLVEPPEVDRPSKTDRPRVFAGPLGRLRAHRPSLILCTVLLVVVGLANAWNLHGWPGRINDDEGTYVDQAWAMVARGDIAHYTYWYDHPFLGWALIAGYAWLTDGFARAPSAVMVGREAMLGCVVVSSALLYVLARRLHFHPATAALAVLAFGLSPLAIFLHRMVFLDNIAVMWMLAALVIATSPRQSLAAAFGTGACFAAGVLSKETIAILLPIVVWMLVQHGHRRNRLWSLGVFATTFVTLVCSYPMYALLKNELIPGPGHVSLGWAVYWQLFARPGSGSLFDPASSTYRLVESWLELDPWLLLTGVALAPIGLFVRRLRPIAAALILQILLMFRGGYVPLPYGIALLPFAALLIGGIADVLPRSPLRPPAGRRSPGRLASSRRIGWVPLAAGALAVAVLVAPAWVHKIRHQATVDGSADSRAATRWVVDHVPRDGVVIVDDYIWLDLTLRGFTKPVWMWKLDSDPEVMAEILPEGYLSVHYVVLPDESQDILDTHPTLKAAVANSAVITSFGEIKVRKVLP